MKQPKVVVVTGASAGVGRAVVRRFARAGYDVGLIARGHAGLVGARREVEAAGRRAVACQVDVTRAADLSRAADRIEQTLGPIDVWVNSAMTTVFGQFNDVTPDEFKRVTEVGYLGFVNGTRAALMLMSPRNRGTIVQVGSALAYRAIPLQSAYCGAKHAIRGFTDSVRTELRHTGSNVWITMVQLPAVNTPQFDWCMNRMARRAQPVPPIYQPEIAADAIFFAARKRRREIYVGGTSIFTILANKIAPGIADRYLARTGFRSQQYDGRAPERRSNLWQPLDDGCDRGAHGAFDTRAVARSRALWWTMHKRKVALGVAAIAGGWAIRRAWA